jgi:YD repeat-containing protein
MFRSTLTSCLLFLSASLFAQEATIAELKSKKVKKQTATVTYSDGTKIVTIYYYDAMGNDTATYYNGVRTNYKSIQYNRKGNIDKVLIYDNAGNEKETTVYTYNTDGSATAVNKDTQFGLAYNYKYDKNGNKTEFKIPDGTVIKYTYDSKNRLAKTQAIPGSPDDVKYVITYTYNAKNRVATSKQTGDNPHTGTYEYDANGLLKKKITKAGKYKTTYTYEYSY